MHMNRVWREMQKIQLSKLFRQELILKTAQKIIQLEEGRVIKDMEGNYIEVEVKVETM